MAKRNNVTFDDGDNLGNIYSRLHVDSAGKILHGFDPCRKRPSYLQYESNHYCLKKLPQLIVRPFKLSVLKVGKILCEFILAPFILVNPN